MKFYGLNKFYCVSELHVGSGLFGHPTKEEAEAAARDTAARYGDQEFVRVVQASNSNEARTL